MSVLNMSYGYSNGRVYIDNSHICALKIKPSFFSGR
jgi:hypothetical protein